MSDFGAIILGGGVAGLAAGVELAAKGFKPLLLESSAGLGGRARSFPDAAFGEELDCGPHILVGACHQALDLLSLLGTDKQLFRLPALPFWDEERGFYAMTFPDLPRPWHLAAGILGFPALSWRDKARLLAFGPRLFFASPRRLQGSVSQLLEQWGQSPTINRHLWTTLCLAIMNEWPERTAAAPLVEVFKRSFLGSRDGAHLLLPTRPLSQLLVEPARAFITNHGGEIRTSHRVLALEKNGERIQTVITDQGSLTVSGPVLSALPPWALQRLLPDWCRDQGFHRIATAPIVTVHLGYASPVTFPGHLAGLPEPPFPWIFDRSIFPAAHHPGRLAVVYSGAHAESQSSSAALAANAHALVRRLCPMDPPRAVRVIKERRATLTHSPANAPSRPPPLTLWSNLFLAGDWGATGLPSTMESAIQSGREAARAAFNHCRSK